MSATSQAPKYLPIVVLAFLLVMLVGVGGGIFLIQSRNEASQNAEDTLTGIANLKADQIAGWMRERRSDGELARASIIVLVLLTVLIGALAWWRQQRLRLTLQSATQLQHLNRHLHAIRDCNQALVRITDEHQLLRTICEIICSRAGYRMAWVGLAEDDEDRTVRPVVWAGHEDGYLSNTLISWADVDRGRGPTGTAIRTGQIIHTQDFAVDPRMAPWREAALNRGYRSSVALPIKDETFRTLGALTIYSSEPAAFTPEEIRLLDELTSDLAFGISTLRAHKSRQRVEQAFEESENRLRILGDNLPDGMIYQIDSGVDGKTRCFTYLSAGVEKLHGVTAAAVLQDPMLLYNNVCEEDRRIIAALETEALAAMKPFHAEVRFRLPDGTTRWAFLASAPRLTANGHVIWDGLELDITTRKQAEADGARLQAQLLQSQKMEAVGHLAGGVAHDFNNLLNVILGYCDLALDRMDSAGDPAGFIRQVRQAGERAANLTRQLLAFSRKHIYEPRPLDLNIMIADLSRMLSRLLPENITLAIIPGHNLGTIAADPSQIEQMVINFSVNARDAMPDGGTLSLRTANTTLASRAPIPPGDYVTLSICDTGTGMTDEVKSHLFEPFFTTKPAGKGTGLGLATCYGIAQQNNAHIEVDSAPGKGSTFHLHFPRITTPALPPSENCPDGYLEGGNETILLVEDEEAVRNFSALVLRDLGYRVIEASCGEDALLLAGQNPEIQLLFTDVIMPGMNGRQLADTLKQQRPGLRITFTSGYTNDAIVKQGVRESGLLFLQKPYTATALACKIRAALDARP